MRVRVYGFVSLLIFAFYLLPLAFASPPVYGFAPSLRILEDSELLETGIAKRTRSTNPSPAEIKIVSYNMRWRGGDDLRELIGLLRDDAEIGGAAIVGLQEVDRNKKRTRYMNTARVMAEELGLYYAWAAPPPPAKSKDEKEEETGVAILSLYPLTDVQRIVLPNEGPGGRRRVALGATVRLGERSVRVYSVHAETRISNERRIEQFQAVLDDLTRYTKIERVVVLGDFNTISGDDVRDTTRLFTDTRFSTPFPNNLSTWKTLIIQLKLDWIWLRNLPAVGYGIDKKIGLSDHWPLWVKVKLSDEKDKKAKDR
jgi:endonuclease/exonuclease/phosphatase family metal-dependent hydrolase